MKTIILAGGLGTRISEETENKPKPMVTIGEEPILRHVMEIYRSQGFNEFVLALGYKADAIKRWLLELNTLAGDIYVDTLRSQSPTNKIKTEIDLKVHALETGLHTQTGGRIFQCLSKFPGEAMMATYGDGLANVNIPKLLEFHKAHGKLVTITAVRPPSRFGHIQLSDSRVVSFAEKDQIDTGWINGGFFVIDGKVKDLFTQEDESFEFDTLPALVKLGQVMAYMHEGFWHPMDTLRERNRLIELNQTQKQPPWLQIEN
jgi:glucose-1-phosphate cytidylyltransferase